MPLFASVASSCALPRLWPVCSSLCGPPHPHGPRLGVLASSCSLSCCGAFRCPRGPGHRLPPRPVAQATHRVWQEHVESDETARRHHPSGFQVSPQSLWMQPGRPSRPGPLIKIAYPESSTTPAWDAHLWIERLLGTINVLQYSNPVTVGIRYRDGPLLYELTRYKIPLL
ncbi:XK-related protein 6 [Lates japonicus]|uniref:XK-related protein 6 n=1 Tax=Lates japonicus TaxID=270547 RepID=A0AAD3N4Y1_LATJO|nr:XK-related protein 6 [Lates japonicus]